MENTLKKVAYATPAVLDHGSISDNTFALICTRERGPLGLPRLVCRPVPAPGLSSTF